MSKDKILDRILKLFKLGGNNPSEEETLSALTKARQLMVQHAISEYEVQAELDKQTNTSQRPRIDVTENRAYTRKIRRLARYDEIVALCVGALTDTEPILRTIKTMDGTYVSMNFAGADVDVIVASHLFMIFLPEVRRAARVRYGSAKWDVQHTSYAIGYATRMLDRAREMVTVAPEHADTMALVLYDKKQAISAYLNEQAVTKNTNRDNRITIDPMAYAGGYRDGARHHLDTNILQRDTRDREYGMTTNGTEFRQHQRVMTSHGAGTVVYVRMGAPTFAQVEAVSVILDAKRDRPNYTGTILPVAVVRPVE